MNVQYTCILYTRTVYIHYISPESSRHLFQPHLPSTTAEQMATTVSDSVEQFGLKKINCLAVMSDSCNAMRGAKSGTVVRLKNGGFPNLIELGGCSLHHVANVAKHACATADLGVASEELVKDIYFHFKFSFVEQGQFDSLVSEFTAIKKLAFLRPVHTRWLQVVAVVERVLGLYEPLVRFFSGSARHSGSKVASIQASLSDPKTKYFLTFLAEVLKPLQEFELLFQRERPQIHLLHKHLQDLIKRWLLRFTRPECLPDKFWKVDLTDPSVWLSPYNIGMGEPAKRIFADLSAADQQICLVSVKCFFKAGSEKLREYLPFGSAFLRACQMLDPKHQQHPKFVQWVGSLARCLPSVFADTEIGSLEVEARLHQTEGKTASVEDTDMLEFWKAVSSCNNRPLLTRLVRALLVLPHGNAEVERVFSMLSDTVTKKRSLLKPVTVKALIVSRSCLESKQWSASSLPVTASLINMCNSAHASYRQRLRDEAAAEEKKRAKELEASLVAEVQAEKKASKQISSLEEKLAEKEKEIEAKMKEKEAAHQLLLSAQRATDSRDQEIEALRKEQGRLQKRKEKEAVRLTEQVLKRKACELAMSSSDVVVSELPKIPKNK